MAGTENLDTILMEIGALLGDIEASAQTLQRCADRTPVEATARALSGDARRAREVAHHLSRQVTRPGVREAVDDRLQPCANTVRSR